MKLAIISFTKNGSRLCRILTRGFIQMGHECLGYAKERFLDVRENPLSTCSNRLSEGIIELCTLREPVGAWTGRQFATKDGIIFVGAAGIAVRAIAPYLKDKLQDPAVVVIDEQGHFSISLLSGHVGGANELAKLAAEIAGAQPVITTATDANHIFAVDVFAKLKGMSLMDRLIAKSVSADLLEGRTVGFYSDFPVDGELPEGLVRHKMCKTNIWITTKRVLDPFKLSALFLSEDVQVLRMVPRIITVGIGCRRGTGAKLIMASVEEVFWEQNLDMSGICCVASIDLKKDEEGLLAFAREAGVSFQTYEAKSLAGVSGEFIESEFVKKTTGVGNVCERAALLAACEDGGLGTVLVNKQVKSGVAVSLAVKEWRLSMKEETEHG